MSDVVSRDYSTTEAVWKACQDVANTNPQDFATIKHEDGTLDLTDAVPIIESIIAFFRRVRIDDILMVPELRRTIFSTEVRNVQYVLEQILAMKYRKSAVVRDKLLEAYHSARSELTPFVSLPVHNLTGKQPVKTTLADALRVLDDIKRMKTEGANVLRFFPSSGG